jgi:hypothetical protein
VTGLLSVDLMTGDQSGARECDGRVRCVSCWTRAGRACGRAVAAVMTLRVYVVNRDTGVERELLAVEYEPTGFVDTSGSQALPPCACPNCRSAREFEAQTARTALEAPWQTS